MLSAATAELQGKRLVVASVRGPLPPTISLNAVFLNSDSSFHRSHFLIRLTEEINTLLALSLTGFEK